MSIRTVNLETSKLLKESGFRQDTGFCWRKRWYGAEKINNKWVDNYGSFVLLYEKINPTSCDISCAAPTTDELLEELPWRINPEHYPCDLNIWRGHKNWHVAYVNPVHAPQKRQWACNIINESLPEALAQMWFWLKKKGLIGIAEKNGLLINAKKNLLHATVLLKNFFQVVDV